MIGTGVLVRTHKFLQLDSAADTQIQGFVFFIQCLQIDVSRGYVHHCGIVRSDGNIRSIHGGDLFHSGAHDGGLRIDEWDRLTLHVRAHQSAVRVVVFQERNHRRGYRNHLLRSHVHILYFIGAHLDEFSPFAGKDHLVRDAAIVVQMHIRLSNNVFLFLGSVHIHIFIAYRTIRHLPVRSFDKTKGIDAAIDSRRHDKADVWPFRSLDGAHAPIV